MPSPSSMNEEPTKDLSEFFHAIWGETDGFVYLPTLDRETGEWHRVFFQWPVHENFIVKHVMAAAAKRLDSYYSPAIYKSAKSATKDNILGTNVLWAEFDGEAPETWGAPLEGSEGDRASEGPSRAYSGPLPEPTLRVQTSTDGHEHVYWRLDSLVTDVQWIDDKNRAITYSMRSDTSGWDATQILRPPYTRNTKTAEGMPVTVVDYNDKSYSTDTFGFLKPPVQIVSEVIADVEIGDLPPVELLIAKYKWDEDHYKLFADSNVPQGNRSDALMRIGYFCAEVGMTDTEMYAILIHADNRWGKYKDRADRKRRLVDIINRARVKHPNPISDATFAGLLSSDQATEVGTAPYYGLMDFLESEVHVEWAIEGLLEKGGFGTVAAMPGVGKTQWSIQLAIMAALGRNFLGWQVCKPHKVALLSLEMSHVALKIFLQTIIRQYSEQDQRVLQENLIIVPFGQPLSIDKAEGFQFLCSLLDDIQPEGIVIDSVGKLTMEDLNEKTAKTLNTRYLSLRARYGTFIWLIHHNRKATDNNKKPTNLSDVYGNVYLTAEMTSCIVLWPADKTKTIEVIPVKMRLSELRDPFHVTRNENLFFEEVGKEGLAELVGSSAIAEEASKNDRRSTFGDL